MDICNLTTSFRLCVCNVSNFLVFTLFVATGINAFSTTYNFSVFHLQHFIRLWLSLLKLQFFRSLELRCHWKIVQFFDVNTRRTCFEQDSYMENVEIVVHWDEQNEFRDTYKTKGWIPTNDLFGIHLVASQLSGSVCDFHCSWNFGLTRNNCSGISWYSTIHIVQHRNNPSLRITKSVYMAVK